MLKLSFGRKPLRVSGALLTLLWTSISGAPTPLAAQQVASLPPVVRPAGTPLEGLDAYRLVEEELGAGSIVLLGDTHRNGQILSFMATTVPALVERGQLTHLALEIGADQQGALDHFFATGEGLERVRLLPAIDGPLFRGFLRGLREVACLAEAGSMRRVGTGPADWTASSVDPFPSLDTSTCGRNVPASLPGERPEDPGAPGEWMDPGWRGMLHPSAGGLRVVAIDVPAQTRALSRDAFMAVKLAHIRREQPEARILVLVGNIHAMKSMTWANGETARFIPAYLQRTLPGVRTVSIHQCVRSDMPDDLRGVLGPLHSPEARPQAYSARHPELRHLQDDTLAVVNLAPGLSLADEMDAVIYFPDP